MTLELFLLIMAILFTSLATGIFLDYVVSINRASARLGDREYVRLMQHINDVIENGLFLTVFMMPIFLLPLVTFLFGGGFGSIKFILFALATVLYVGGMFGITMVGNVPMNRRLSAFQLDKASDEEVKAARSRFEYPWNRLHNLRTSLGVLSVICLCWAAII